MNNPFSLTDKKILVTGASSGIGRQTAISTSFMGASLILSARNLERLEETKKMCKDESSVSLLRADLLNDEEVDQLVLDLPELDGIVLVSGIMKTLPFKFVTRKDIELIMQTNFLSPAIFLSKLLKKNKIKNGGSIVFVSSIGGNNIGTIGNSMYGSTKAAINGLQKTLTIEVAPKKIRVNNVAPGMVKTEMWQNGAVSSDELKIDEKKYPLGYGTTEDVANGIIYLLSDASKWVTGTSLILDGGFTIQ